MLTLHKSVSNRFNASEVDYYVKKDRMWTQYSPLTGSLYCIALVCLCSVCSCLSMLRVFCAACVFCYAELSISEYGAAVDLRNGASMTPAGQAQSLSPLRYSAPSELQRMLDYIGTQTGNTQRTACSKKMEPMPQNIMCSAM